LQRNVHTAEMTEGLQLPYKHGYCTK
jgi:hypothetical protein